VTIFADVLTAGILLIVVCLFLIAALVLYETTR
jgi:hypothetical protein